MGYSGSVPGNLYYAQPVYDFFNVILRSIRKSLNKEHLIKIYPTILSRSS